MNLALVIAVLTFAADTLEYSPTMWRRRQDRQLYLDCRPRRPQDEAIV